MRSPRFYRALLRGSIGLCESYMDGLWECDDLVALTRIAALNVGALDRLRRAARARADPACSAGCAGSRATRRGRSRRQIAAHYDLGNELFALFLDPTMMYSCAVFEAPEATLEEASLAKLERVCAKLDLGPERPRAGDRHRLGRLRRVRRRALRLPRDDDDDLARTARLRDRARARGRAWRIA